MNSSQNIMLSATDVEAILAALPVVECSPADSSAQKFRNQSSCYSAKQKLLSGRKDFTANEQRVIAVSVCYVSEYLSGRMPELEKLYPEISKLRKYSLSYARMTSHFLPKLMALDN